MKKLTNTERASKAGKARWAKVPKEKRTLYSRRNAKKLWSMIKQGKYASSLDK